MVKPGAFLLVNTIEFFIRVLPEQESGKVLKKKNLPRNREDPNQKPLTIKPYPMKIRC